MKELEQEVPIALAPTDQPEPPHFICRSLIPNIILGDCHITVTKV